MRNFKFNVVRSFMVCAMGMLMSTLITGDVYADCFGGHDVDLKDIDSVRRFCEDYPDFINAPEQPNGDTPLIRAVQLGCVDSVKYLVEHGADVNAKVKIIMGNSIAEVTALESAVINRHLNLDVVKYLVEHGADVNVKLGTYDKSDEKLLYEVTPLTQAVDRGYLDVVKCFVENGADVNAKGNNSQTPLWRAIDGVHPEIVKCLIEHSAEIDKSVVQRAKCLIDFILHYRSTLTDVYISNVLKIVECLLDHGLDANVNVKNELLGLALKNKKIDLDVVKCLLEHGADANVKFNYPYTPLSWAIQRGDLDLVKCLVEHGVDVNAEFSEITTPLKGSIIREEGRAKSPLVLAIYCGYEDIVKYLVEHGAKIEDDAVEYEATHENLKAIKLLVEHGAKIGDYAVYYAAGVGGKRGRLNIVKYLVEHGAKIGDRVVYYAAGSGKMDIVKYLVEQGAKIDEHTIDYAAYSGHLDIVKYLTEKSAEK